MSAADRRRPVLDRRSFVASLAASGLHTRSLAAEKISPSEPSLATLAAARGVAFGMMLTEEQVRASPGLVALAISQSALLVPGVELVWCNVEPQPGRFDVAAADAVLDLARRQGLSARGHTLVWHEGLPDWVASLRTSATMGQAFDRHIRTLCRHYAGRLHSWDVVNEAIQPGDRSDGLRQTPFLATLGADYIERAFRLAAEADPVAVMTLNDYDLELDTDWQARRRGAMLDLLNRLVRRRVPIGALGIQGHLDPAKGRFDPEVFRRFLRSVASLGLEVFITELDAIDRTLPADAVTRDTAVAEATRLYLRTALAEPCVRLVTTWGVSDAFTWVDGNPQTRRLDGLAARPHAYDADFRPKPVRHAMAEAFRGAPARGALQ